ncbi:MAG: hypothetical protein ACTHNH_11020 [Mesorhizobium sp.]
MTGNGLAEAIGRHGLVLRGGFVFDKDEAAPLALSDRPARSVIQIGNAGASHWPHFQRWRDGQPADLENPLDTWCREVIGGIAQDFGARAVSPSDRPFLPFQQWAMRAEGLKSSPLGILMHPEYGLWHAYRGALLFDVELAVEPVHEPIHLCDACVGKPCLKACPVDAYTPAGFAYEGCLAHVRGPKGKPCRTVGCIDRNACPYGVAYRYPAEVQAFHMKAFAKL